MLKGKEFWLARKGTKSKDGLPCFNDAEIAKLKRAKQQMAADLPEKFMDCIYSTKAIFDAEITAVHAKPPVKEKPKVIHEEVHVPIQKHYKETPFQYRKRVARDSISKIKDILTKGK